MKKLWVVRWSVDGRAHSKAFATSNEANRYRSLLVAAHQKLERFDRPSGEPESWRPRADPTQVHAWCRRWIAEQWNEWQPRTRTSAIEALARFVALAVAPTVLHLPRMRCAGNWCARSRRAPRSIPSTSARSGWPAGR